MILEVVKKLAQRLEDVFSILSQQGSQNGRQELNVASNSKLLFCHGIAQVAQKGTCYWCVQPYHPSCLFSLQGTNKVFSQSFKTPVLVFCFVLFLEWFSPIFLLIWGKLSQLTCVDQASFLIWPFHVFMKWTVISRLFTWMFRNFSRWTDFTCLWHLNL